MRNNPNGRVLYEGPSMLDGAPIVVIATGFAERSGNAKTGSMIQTWILRADVPPHHAFSSEDGASVCGDCPPWVWQAILPRTRGRTGYTHQWRRPIGAWLRGIVQASCDSLQDLADARAAGWRTFTVLPLGAPDPSGTAHCAASTERGNKTNCATCGLCDGASADIAIWAHGSRAAHVQPTAATA